MVGYYCDSNTLTPLTKTGYYIDSGRFVEKNTPFIFYCNGDHKCSPVDNPYQYYLNAGINYIPEIQSTSTSIVKNEKNLIYCNGKNCNIVASTSGYYVAGTSPVDVYANRLIYCNENNVCNDPRPISVEAAFINNGIDNHQKPLIYCNLDTCATQAISTGYFISENQDKLIYCELSTCKEIKANPGYYYYGGSQISKKYLISCEREVSSDGIVCELIEGEIGFYVSNTSNVLINCVGDQCKSIVARNGIYRSATTVKTASKREYSRFSRRANVTYNLIVCNQEGCHELSTAELAEVPICSYVDDICNIVLPSTATSTFGYITNISSGDYCTSADRSQIYFATGPVVVESTAETNELSSIGNTKNCLQVPIVVKYTLPLDLWLLNQQQKQMNYPQ